MLSLIFKPFYRSQMSGVFFEFIDACSKYFNMYKLCHTVTFYVYLCDCYSDFNVFVWFLVFFNNL